MNNSASERFGFFCSYRFRKLFSSTTTDDLFRKRFYRATAKDSVSIEEESENELIFSLKSKNGNGLKCCVRKKNSSDIQVYEQVFLKKEYKALADLILDSGKPEHIRFVIDAGANIGFTSIYLHQFFPLAHFIVIEPDEKNFEQMKKNFQLNSIENTEMLLSGLWTSDGWLQINRDADSGKEWSYRVTASDKPTTLKSISFSTILNNSEFSIIDILKIDIEGGEAELFSIEAIISPVLQKTRFLAMEIHDHLADRQHIISILEKNKFKWFQHEELTIASNQSLLY